jgi:superfamily II DNA/RNA helicase
MENLINKTNYVEKLHQSTEFYKNYLLPVNKDLTNNLDLVISPFFMLLEHHIKDVNFLMKQFLEGESKQVLDKKSKYVLNVIESNCGQKIICCSESNIEHLKDFLKRRRIKFISLDEKDRVGHRLFTLMQYKRNECDILLITPIFLKSLNIHKFNHLILFDYLADQRDLIRILVKFPKVDEANTTKPESKSLHILYDENDEENNNAIIEYLKNKSSKK